jgi:hemolysin type calcium-binding protein
VLAVGLLGLAAALAPAAAAAQPGVTTAVWAIHGSGATASSAINVLTLNDQRRIDNRITAYTGSGGRLILTAPEGLGDPDGSGTYCGLDNAKPGESSATEVSCAPGYIGAIAGYLGGGSDTFNADPGLAVMVGGVIDGEYRPLSGGPGRDRLVGGALGDLIDGGPGADTVIGGGGDDGLIGGGGADKLNGAGGTDLCRGGGGLDTGKSCEQRRSIP